MKVRGKKAPAQHKGQTEKRPANAMTFPAPIRGWDLSSNLATPEPGGARVLENFVCTTTGIRARGGNQKYATLGSAVTALFTYSDGGAETFFGATATAIYDITTVADPDVTPSAAVSSQTGGDYSVQQFGTAGGAYMYAVNGEDSAQLFDGASWTQITGVSSPAITGVTTAGLSQVWSFGSRLWFVEKNTQSAWYLPVDSIGGAATEFSLAGVSQSGGALLFGARWSLDSGDGLDDKCVFVFDTGEIIVYEGSDPASASTFAKVGSYQITAPLGKNAHIQIGGELFIATKTGLIPVSGAINLDITQLALDALSFKIAPHWQQQANTLTDYGWTMARWPEKNYVVVSQPGPSTSEGSALVVNTQTNAWSRFTGWETRCVGYFSAFGFFGDPDGVVFRMEAGGSDNGSNYTCTYLGLADPMGHPGQQKTALQARAVFKATTPINPRVTALADFSEATGTPPASPADFSAPVWDTAVWDTDVWDGSAAGFVSDDWDSVGRTGHTLAPLVQLTFGYTPTPDVDLVEVTVPFMPGSLVA